MNIEEIKERVNSTKNAFHKIGIDGQINLNLMINDIEYLLTAYEKEKEKNKELNIAFENCFAECTSLRKNFHQQIEISKNINKKWKDKIEELENEHTGSTRNVFSVLQSLLEEKE